MKDSLGDSFRGRSIETDVQIYPVTNQFANRPRQIEPVGLS